MMIDNRYSAIMSQGSLVWARVREGALGVARTVFSFEAAFLAFVFAGNYKGAAWLAEFPIDLTLLWFCVSLVLGGVIILRHSPLPSSVVRFGLAGVAFCLFPLVSLAWSPGQVYARQKAIYVATLTLWSFLGAAWVIGPSRDRVRRFAILLGAAAGALAVAVLVKHLAIGLDIWGTSARVLGATYLNTARLVGLGAVVLGAVWWCWEIRWYSRVIVAAVYAFLLFMVVDIGSRGPMIGVFAASVLPVAVGFKSETVRQVRSWKGLVAAGVVLALVVGGVYWYRHVYGMFPTGITRMLRIGKAIAGETNDKRVQLMGAAVRGWLQRPLLGHGCGAFPLLWGGWDAKAHPHNMVLEILVELGIVGLGLFGVLCSMAYGLLGSLSRLQREPWRMLVLMLLVMLFMHAMVSCDLHENRALFMVLGMFSLGAAKPFAGD